MTPASKAGEKADEPTVETVDAPPLPDHSEPQSIEDMTQTGSGTTQPWGVPTDPPVESGVLLSSPRPDRPIVVSRTDGPGTHMPPNPEEFDEEGRIRHEVLGT